MNDARLKEGTQAHYRDPLYYDHVYRRRRSDVHFYLSMAKQIGGPVLELGVGTGRVAFALARAGITVTGIDSQPEMLALAQEKISKLPKGRKSTVEFVQGDIRSIRLARRFPLIIAPFNVFMHLYSRNDVEQTLATCHAHLRSRGQLLFDVRLPDIGSLIRSPDRFYKLSSIWSPSHQRRFAYREAFDYEAIQQIQWITLRYIDSERPQCKPRDVLLAHRQFFPAELEALLHYNRFDMEARWGDFERGSLTEESESQIILARRHGG